MVFYILQYVIETADLSQSLSLSLSLYSLVLDPPVASTTTMYRVVRNLGYRVHLGLELDR